MSNKSDGSRISSWSCTFMLSPQRKRPGGQLDNRTGPQFIFALDASDPSLADSFPHLQVVVATESSGQPARLFRILLDEIIAFVRVFLKVIQLPGLSSWSLNVAPCHIAQATFGTLVKACDYDVAMGIL